MEVNNDESITSNIVPQQAAQPIVPISNTGMSNDTKTIITVLLLVFVYPVGVIFMWLWMKWARWVKLVLTLVMLLPIIIGIILSIFLIVLNPKQQLSKARNAKRTADITAIANAIVQHKVDNNNQVPGLTNNNFELSSQGLNLCSVLVPRYLSALPIDPLIDKGASAVTDCSAQYDTGYTISLDSQGFILVSAPKAELGSSIFITK